MQHGHLTPLNMHRRPGDFQGGLSSPSVASPMRLIPLAGVWGEHYPAHRPCQSEVSFACSIPMLSVPVNLCCLQLPNIQPGSGISNLETDTQNTRSSQETQGLGNAVFSTEHLHFPSSFLLILLSIKNLLKANAINLDL